MRIVPLAVAVLAACGCASAPERVAAIAREAGFTRTVVRGASFEHVVFESPGNRPARPPHQADVLHVYIEGDGRPYLDRWTVAADPTPRNPLMLRLMALDPQPAVYLGRPCYFGLASEPPCTPLDWTLDRFSDPVVASLAQALAEIRRGHEDVPVELYGHSGGGALAVLLATRVPRVRRVVTLAGNLDPDAWTAYHGYTPLTGSLNPARRGSLPPAIVQQHFAGDRDRVIPAEMIEDAAARIGAPAVTRLPAVSHARGWEDAWPAILGDGQRDSNRTPAVSSP